MIEIFVDIKNHEGTYQISNHGNVRNIARGRMLKPWDNGNGYAYVSLVKNGKTFKQAVHRLVCKHFQENPNNWNEVNHKDGDKFNNHLDNLEWCTPKHNSLHRQTMMDKKREATFHFINPEGEIVSIINLTKFCRENDLSRGMLGHVHRGKVQSFRGWRKYNI